MLASELIKTYEEFCPQELSMEGDVVVCRLAVWTRKFRRSWLPWMFVKIQ